MHRRAFLQRVGLTAGGVAIATVLPDPEPPRSYFFGPWKPAVAQPPKGILWDAAGLPNPDGYRSLGERQDWPVLTYARADHIQPPYVIAIDPAGGPDLQVWAGPTADEFWRMVATLQPGDSATFVRSTAGWHVG